MKDGDFMFFKKKKITIVSVASGELHGIEEVPDDVFSKKLLGEGYEIIPDEDKVSSPIDGIVTNVFDTKHAISIKNDEVEVLVHMGLDTVELKGEPFQLYVTTGQTVKAGEVLATMDRELVTESNKKTNIVVVVMESDKYKNIELDSARLVKPGEPIMSMIK